MSWKETEGNGHEPETPHAGEYRWGIDLYVICPSCKEEFDANDSIDFVDQLANAQVGQAMKNCLITCPSCEHEFRFNLRGGLK